MARTTRTEGIVKVIVQIDSTGRAASVSIQSGPPLLRPAVQAFLEQSEFATCRGEVEIAFQFTLGNGPLETLEFLAPNLYRLTTEAAKLMVEVGLLAQPVK
jgi:hypothetical protein